MKHHVILTKLICKIVSVIMKLQLYSSVEIENSMINPNIQNKGMVGFNQDVVPLTVMVEFITYGSYKLR